MKRNVMMRASNSFIAACLLIALSVTGAHAAEATCPSADQVKSPVCGVKDEQSGMDVCKYRVTTENGSVWVGEDPDELGKDGGSVSVESESSHTQDNVLYCDYKLKQGDKESAVRLSLER
jgi:hypothetical protein